MRSQFNTAVALLLAGFAVASAVQSQQPPARPDANQLGLAGITSNIPSRSGEASTMTNGVPNLLTSNVQPGELGIQTRLTVRRAGIQPPAGSELKLMGASGAVDAGPGPTSEEDSVR